jgi:DNA/RNA endonuclease YhcR with UshA esterase domain
MIRRVSRIVCSSLSLGSLDFSGRTIEATGLVELYKGRPQIMIGVPVRLKRVDGRIRASF